MATTGFWPVKGSLKAALDYAKNPDKTTNRYGKLGGNVAYHGYVSFPEGEVTPAEAHTIGMEVARQRWGQEYEILVTTHLNTGNIHCHIVVNSVSFRTGRKFENHISDHIRLREISDAVCLEHGKSILEGSSFYGGEKDGYWARKAGKLNHRDMLRLDLNEAIAACSTWRDLERCLIGLSYRFQRDFSYEHWMQLLNLRKCKQFSKIFSPYLAAADEGISGTSTKHRDDFNRMIRDAKAGLFDFIITKEMSRFSRSTLDSIQYTQELLDYNVGVFFQNDNINTLDTDSEFRLVIMAGIAQDEVRKLSERLKFGFRQAIKNSHVLGNDRLYGYFKDKCVLSINEEEAEIVRTVFDLYGNKRLGTRAIAKELEKRGTPAGRGIFSTPKPSGTCWKTQNTRAGTAAIKPKTSTTAPRKRPS